MATDELFDVTARKFHQIATLVLLVAGFVLGAPADVWLVGLAGLIMLAGRFWWPADVFRQFTWRVLEPSGMLKRRDVNEDHDTRRVARVLGGIGFLLGAVLLAAGFTLAWILIGLVAVMMALDAAFNFCVLCFLTYQVGKLQAQH